MSYGINPIIYILVESAVRELDSKLLTALFLIKKGFHVVLGQQWILTLNRNCLPTGTFFFKGMNKIHTDNMARVHQFGHTVVAMEEELLGLCMYPPECYVPFLRGVFHTDANRHCQLFLAAHNLEMRIVKQIMPSLNARLTGNPRTDCLRPELVSIHDPMRREISEKMPSGYILINTNLGMLNSRLSSKVISDLDKRAAPKEEKWAKRYNEWKTPHVKGETYDMKSTFKLIELFGQHSPNQKVLIRPHPWEKTGIYTRFSRKYLNVEVADNRNLACPWILASDVLIHTGCTTGIEAVAMNHPTISIQGKDSDSLQFKTTNQVSYLTHTAEEAYQAVQDFYAGKLMNLGNPSKLKEFWPAQEGKFAAERIADEIHQFYLDLGGTFEEFKLSFSGKFRFPKNAPSYVYHKMLVGLPQVEHMLSQISQKLPAAPNIELHEICTNVFYIRPS